MKKLITILFLSALLIGGGGEGVWAGDACQDPTILKTPVAVSIGSATTSKIVDIVTGKSIALCGCSLTATGTSPTLLFKYGTHTSADCDTGAASISGTMAPTAGTPFQIGGGYGPSGWAPAGNQLCITVGGTGPSLQGVCTYATE